MGWGVAPDEGERWGINNIIRAKPVSRVITSDPADDITVVETRKLAEESNTPFVGQENYPLKEIIKEFGTDYFSCTLAYAIALAIYEGYQEIEIFGVNWDDTEEYNDQRAGIDFWCGFAKGRGVKITIQGTRAQAMQTRNGLLYGFGIPQGMTQICLR